MSTKITSTSIQQISQWKNLKNVFFILKNEFEETVLVIKSACRHIGDKIGQRCNKLYKCLSHFIEQKGLVFNVDDKSQTVWLNSIDMRLLDFNRLSIFCISIDSANYGSQSIK